MSAARCISAPISWLRLEQLRLGELPAGDATTDTLVIEYRARVVENVLAHLPSTALVNTATLSR